MHFMHVHSFVNLLVLLHFFLNVFVSLIHTQDSHFLHNGDFPENSTSVAATPCEAQGELS